MCVSLLDGLPGLGCVPLTDILSDIIILTSALAPGHRGLDRGYWRDHGEVLNSRGQPVLDRGKQSLSLLSPLTVSCLALPGLVCRWEAPAQLLVKVLSTISL